MEILGCQTGVIPFKYLGDWVGLEKKPCMKWLSLVDQMKSKLQGWKCSQLNMAGRLLLIKSSLDNISTYWLVCIESRRQFLKVRCYKENFFLGGTSKWRRICEENAYSQLEFHFLQ